MAVVVVVVVGGGNGGGGGGGVVLCFLPWSLADMRLANQLLRVD